MLCNFGALQTPNLSKIVWKVLSKSLKNSGKLVTSMVFGKFLLLLLWSIVRVGTWDLRLGTEPKVVVTGMILISYCFFLFILKLELLFFFFFLFDWKNYWFWWRIYSLDVILVKVDKLLILFYFFVDFLKNSTITKINGNSDLLLLQLTIS